MADNQQYGPLAPKQTTAEDIRKVVANGPKALGQGSTIATSDELAKKKEEAKAKNRKVNITTPTQKISTTGGKTTTAVTTPKQSGTAVKTTNNTQQGINKFASLIQGQVSGDLFKNPAMQPIDNVKVVKQDNEATHNVAPENTTTKTDMFINNTAMFDELKTPIDIDNPLFDLFEDVKKKYKKGTLTADKISLDKLRQLPRYEALSNMSDEDLYKVIGTFGAMVKNNIPMNADNLNKIKTKIPSLNSAQWGFDKGIGENMYQAGGMKEQLSATSPTDMNKAGKPGMVAEAAVNPMGEAFTLLDMGAQQIPQKDDNNSMEKKLRAELQKIVSDKDLLNQYFEQYKEFVKKNPLEGLYTTRIKGDNVAEQTWNLFKDYNLMNIIAGGKKTGSYRDVEAGFKDWLITTVNNKLNGWSGEFWGVGDELRSGDIKGGGGPNLAKMYVNTVPSAVKTASAIARAISNPVDTGAGLAMLISDTYNHIADGTFSESMLGQRYGSWEAWEKAIEQDPIGVASDILSIIELGAGGAKLAAGGASKSSLAAAIATESLGAMRASEGLLKLASRLEHLMKSAGEAGRIAGGASNLGMDIPLKGGSVRIGDKVKMVDGIVGALRKWGESGDSLIQKYAKYSANAADTGITDIAKKTKDVIKNGPINSLADMLMGTASDTDKLMKAASPAINKLTNNVDYKNKRKKLDIAENAVVEAGYTPKTIAEWAKAHTETLNKKWNEFKQMVKDKSDYEIDVKEILTEVKDYIKREKEGATAAQKADLRKLEVEVQDLERRGKVDMGFIENRKEHYNSSWRDSDKLKVGDVYLKGIKLIGNAMRKQQDNILGKGPEQTKKLRQEISALMDTKEDILKADLRNQKKKSDIAGGGLVESYGRLSGLGDIVGGILSTPVKGGEGLAQAGKGLGKLVFGKAMGKARDVDYLTKKGFEGLSKKKGLGAQKEGGLRSKLKSINELKDLIAEKEKLKKQLKEGKITQEEYNYKVHKTDDKHIGLDYAIAQARSRSTLGDKEGKMSAESKKKVLDYVSKRAKDVDFVTKVAESMEEDKKGSWTDVQKKLIQYEKDPTNTTYQHELFHAFFSVVDNKTKTYILDEAKKILKMEGLRDVNAEEWLAESFGIYAKRQQIKLGLIEAPKGFVDKVRDFFQRVYEYMQRFNGDRATINKLFDEVLGDRKMKNGIMDLSDLLGNKEVKSRKLYSELGDNRLMRKSVYHGSPADFDKFDSSHMGEGEGAQAHGWGHYVAVEERTGRHYADMKNPSNYEYKGRGLKDIDKELWSSKPGEKVELIPIRQMLDSEWKGRYQKGERFDIIKKEGLEEASKQLELSKRMYEKNPEYKERYNIDKRLYDAWKNLDKKDFDFEKPSRNLYSLEIPDPVKADTPTGSNYLDEKKELTSKQVGEFFDKLKEKYPEIVDKSSKGGFGRDRMSIEYHWYEKGMPQKITAERLYEQISTILGSDKAASKFLESLGYDGIHYFGARDGEAYVIFNDDALQIKDHIRYKKKIGNKDVEITPEADSPDQLIEKNADGLSVMKSFISEKQAEKALDVNKALLDKDGNPYLWTHTNKYDAPQFANFENTKDSKYKEFSDYEIAFFSNSEEMSKSYAKGKSKLANTKGYKDVEDFNKQNLTVEKSKSDQTTRKGVKIPTEYELSKGIRIIEGKSGKARIKNVIEHKYVLDTSLDKLLDDMDIAKEGYMPDNDTKHVLSRKERIERVKWEFAGNYSWGKWDVDVKELPNGKVEIIRSKNNILPEEYDSAKAAMAEYTASKTEKQPYHYQGIVTDVKNPLVVDLGKKDYGLKDWKTGEKYNTGRGWNDLDTAYDLLEKYDKEGLKKLEKVNELFNKTFGELSKKRKEILGRTSELRWEYSKRYDDFNDYHLGKGERTEKNLTKLKKLDSDMANALNASFSINRLLGGEIKEINSDILEFIKSHDDYNKVYNDVLDFLKNNKDNLEYISYGDKRKDFKDWLINNGLDEDVATLLHDIRFSGDDDIIELLKNKDLQTNDYVFYALKNGGYDGVIFKDILDFGSNDAFDKAQNKGGDVLVTFKSKDFKAWDNANPTDSKYISYKKKVKLDKKSEGLQKKNSSGLLAKGRDRMGDNGMRYKTNISEKDSSGKKLSEGQKKFFAGSKVVDRDGNLLRVYHGTRGRFTVFDNSKGDYVSNSMAKIGNWFTPSKEGAKKWAEENSLGMKPKAMGGYLDIKNPKIYEKWDTTEHLKKTGEARENAIEGINKYLDNIGFNPLKNEWNKKYFEKAPEGYENRYRYGQNEAINKALEGLNYLSKVQDLESYLKYDFSDKKKFYDAMKEKGYSDNKIREIAKEAGAWLKKMEDIGNELKKAEFTDAYELFENDLRSFGGQTIKDRVGGGWMAMDDEAKAVKDYVKSLKDQGYDGIIIKATEYDGDIFGEINDQYVAFDSNQFKNIDNKNPTKNQDIRYKAAWHGSPAKFDKFDSSHMGEGEGAQAHGWGHYVALDRKTAEKYAEMRDENLTTRKLGGLTAKQWSSKYNGGDNSADTYAKWKVANGMQGNFFGTKSLEEAKKNAIYLEKQTLDKYKGWLDNKPSMIDGKEYIHADGGLYPKDVVKSEVKKMEDRIKAMEGLSEKDLVIENKNIGKRNLYELDIPEPEKRNTPTGKNYLDEDAELSKAELNKFADELDKSKKLRSLSDMNMDDVKKIGEIIGEKDYVEQVKNSLEKHPEESLSNVAFETLRYYRGEDGLRKYDFYAIKKLQDKLGISAKNSDTFRNANSMNGKYLYKTLSDILGSDKQASKFLESLGYDGIHYVGGQDGEAYVLFKDESPQIKNTIRYKKGLTSKDQTQTPEFKKWFEGSKVVDKSGKPLEVVHETYWDALKEPKGKAAFDKKYSSSGGFWFSDIGSTPGLEYGDKKLKVFLNMQNPNIVESEHFPGRGVIIAAAEEKGYDGAIWKGKRSDGKDYTVYYVNEPNQIKSATDNIGTFDKNNPDIRYKRNNIPLQKLGNYGLQHKEKNLGTEKIYKVVSGNEQEMKSNLSKLVRYLRNDSVSLGLKPANYTKGTSVENALNELKRINYLKDDGKGRYAYADLKDGKNKIIVQIGDMIDAGYGDGVNYGWFWDGEEHQPTVIFWKGDMNTAIRKRKYWAFHSYENKLTKPSIDKFRQQDGSLTPIRL